MNKVNLRGINVYPFSSKEELLDYVIENKRILIAINAEKIMNATDDLKRIINDVLVLRSRLIRVFASH